MWKPEVKELYRGNQKEWKESGERKKQIFLDMVTSWKWGMKEKDRILNELSGFWLGDGIDNDDGI